MPETLAPSSQLVTEAPQYHPHYELNQEWRIPVLKDESPADFGDFPPRIYLLNRSHGKSYCLLGLHDMDKIAYHSYLSIYLSIHPVIHFSELVWIDICGIWRMLLSRAIYNLVIFFFNTVERR